MFFLLNQLRKIDYYCESGLCSSQFHHKVLYSTDTLWDGQQCNGNEGPCCTNPKMPWFIKTLNETTTEDIELRMCCFHCKLASYQREKHMKISLKFQKDFYHIESYHNTS